MFYRLISLFALSVVLHAAPGFAAASINVPSQALGASPIVDGKPCVTARLLTDTASVSPGDSLQVGVLFEMEPGWHIYWRNPGNAGFATELNWQVGDASMGALRWPAPSVFRESDGTTITYGYQDEVLLSAPATVSDSVGQSVNLMVQARYLACKVVCSPGQVTLSRTIPVGVDQVPAEDQVVQLFAKTRKHVPMAPAHLGLKVAEQLSQTPIRPGDAFTVALDFSAACADPRCPVYKTSSDVFVPDVIRGLHMQVLGSRPNATSGVTILLRGQLDADVASQMGDTNTLHLRGLARLERDGVVIPPVDIDIQLPFAEMGTAVQTVAVEGPQAAPAAHSSGLSRWRALLLALLGGIILNLMPCVLPVLAIKVLGITSMGRLEKRHIAAHGAAYVAGVIGTMALLAWVVIALKAAGTAVGWGFQFQEPWFVTAVSAVLVLFALNCFGAFEITVGGGALGSAGSHAHGLRRSFFDGILAVVLATPCSAPFLGPAVAFALTRSSATTLAIFVAIGLGLSLPYVALTLMPGFLRFVPKPGRWMEYLKFGLGFGLLGTAIWLVWLIGRVAGVDTMAKLLVFLLATSVLAWVYGVILRRRPERQFWLMLALGVLLPFLAYATLSFDVPDEVSGTSAIDAEWREYSPTAVHKELAAGHPVFVDFTADWCITCKFNESHTLRDPGVLRAFRRTHTVLMRADWTRRDEDIRRTLASFGRAGVPMYLLYSPDNPTGPQLLPELLTSERVLNALDKLKATTP